jgi:hypothetical protein
MRYTRTAAARGHGPISSEDRAGPDRALHDELPGGAWLVGRVTGQEFAKGKPHPLVDEETFSRSLGSPARREAYGVV